MNIYFLFNKNIETGLLKPYKETHDYYYGSPYGNRHLDALFAAFWRL